jgi:putative copper export protein
MHYHIPMHAFLSVLFRWLHIVPAAIIIGGVFTMRVILPIGLRALDDPQRATVLLRCRRVFKMTVHTCILLLLVSGIYNTIANWPAYRATLPMSHAFWGPHVILGLLAIGISLYVLAGHQPPPAHQRWMAINLGVLLVVVLLADLTKWVRDRPASPQKVYQTSAR